MPTRTRVTSKFSNGNPKVTVTTTTNNNNQVTNVGSKTQRKDGTTKKTTQTDYDPISPKVGTTTKTIHNKSGTKTAEIIVDYERRNGNNFKETSIKIIYCPNGTDIKEKTTIVKYWRGQQYRRKKPDKESTYEKWDCSTGNKIKDRLLSLTFPKKIRDYGVLAFAMAALVFIVMCFINIDNLCFLGSVISLIIASLLFSFYEKERREVLMEVMGFEQLFFELFEEEIEEDEEEEIEEQN